MPRPSSILAACFGASCLLAPSPAHAWDILHRCHGDCASQTVHLPAQQVVVETAAPRVVVQPTRALAVPAAAPVVASFFVPMPLQLGVVNAAVPAREPGPTVSVESSALQAVQELERTRLQVAKLAAMHDTELDHVKAALSRVTSAAPAKGPPAASDAAAPNLSDLSSKIDNLRERVNQLEQLIKYHDKAIRDNGMGPKN